MKERTIRLTVTYQLTFDDFAWAFMGAYAFDRANLISAAKTLPLDEIREKAKEYLHESGIGNAFYEVEANCTPEQVEETLKILKRRLGDSL